MDVAEGIILETKECKICERDRENGGEGDKRYSNEGKIERGKGRGRGEMRVMTSTNSPDLLSGLDFLLHSWHYNNLVIPI